jgi:hypothetical protein
LETRLKLFFYKKEKKNDCLFWGMSAAVIASHDEHMLLAVFIIEQTGNELTVRSHWFAADGAGARNARLSYRVAVRTSVYMAELIGHRHGAIYFAYEVFSGEERAVAQRAVYKQTSKRSLLLSGGNLLCIAFLLKKSIPSRKPII